MRVCTHRKATNYTAHTALREDESTSREICHVKICTLKYTFIRINEIINKYALLTEGRGECINLKTHLFAAITF